MFIVGCVGLGLNLISVIFLHGMAHLIHICQIMNWYMLEHGHGHDHGPPSIETPSISIGEHCHESHAEVSVIIFSWADRKAETISTMTINIWILINTMVQTRMVTGTVTAMIMAIWGWWEWWSMLLGTQLITWVWWLQVLPSGWQHPILVGITPIPVWACSSPFSSCCHLFRWVSHISSPVLGISSDHCASAKCWVDSTGERTNHCEHGWCEAWSRKGMRSSHFRGNPYTDNHQIKGVTSIHELHIWRLNQQKTLASVHVVVSENSVEDFMKIARVINECFHANGIHSVTLQPELSGGLDDSSDRDEPSRCQVICGTLCEQLTCCG